VEVVIARKPVLDGGVPLESVFLRHGTLESPPKNGLDSCVTVTERGSFPELEVLSWSWIDLFTRL
jgi:hypothetical protein